MLRILIVSLLNVIVTFASGTTCNELKNAFSPACCGKDLSLAASCPNGCVGDGPHYIWMYDFAPGVTRVENNTDVFLASYVQNVINNNSPALKFQFSYSASGVYLYEQYTDAKGLEDHRKIIGEVPGGSGAMAVMFADFNTLFSYRWGIGVNTRMDDVFAGYFIATFGSHVEPDVALLGV